MLKIKNLEFENYKLTVQLQAKDLENILLNKILEQRPVPQALAPVPQAPVQPVQAPVQAPVQEKTPPISKLEFLNNNFEESLTIEDCFDILKNPEHNHYLFEEQFMGQDGTAKNIMNPKFSLKTQYSESATTNATEIIAALFNKFEKKDAIASNCCLESSERLYSLFKFSL